MMKSPIFWSKPVPYVEQLSGLVTVPSDYDPNEKLPLIVFLHGAGESGLGTPETIEKIRRHGIAKIFCADPDYHGLRVITASPQCPDGFIWDQVTFQLMEWIQSVVQEFHVDESRIAITGLSMGGYGTWNMMTTYPDFFRCAAPICGGGVSWRIDENMKGIKIRTFHSIDDDSVPYTCTVDMVTQARKCGLDVAFTTYTDKGHGCWATAYEETDLIEWLVNPV